MLQILLLPPACLHPEKIAAATLLPWVAMLNSDCATLAVASSNHGPVPHENVSQRFRIYPKMKGNVGLWRAQVRTMRLGVREAFGKRRASYTLLLRVI